MPRLLRSRLHYEAPAETTEEQFMLFFLELSTLFLPALNSRMFPHDVQELLPGLYVPVRVVDHHALAIRQKAVHQLQRDRKETMLYQLLLQNSKSNGGF